MKHTLFTLNKCVIADNTDAKPQNLTISVKVEVFGSAPDVTDAMISTGSIRILTLWRQGLQKMR